MINIVKKLVNALKLTKHEKTPLEKLGEVSRIICYTHSLANVEITQLHKWLDNQEINTVFEFFSQDIKNLNLPEMTGGVNPGDQRAIFYLISSFQPSNVLEIGTHIGCSTVHIALALKSQQEKILTTVDIKDVNDPITQPWKEYQSQQSPQEMINKIGADNYTKFVVSNSLDFFKNNSQKFDFIFLDGLHDAYMVYQEIPVALQHLNENGVILLHDYFPNGEPLWENCPPITGPYLAVKRLQEEWANIKALPLGNLPWPTKLGTHVTSLALLTKNQND